jgi:glucose/arabinose dehydrogenase
VARRPPLTSSAVRRLVGVFAIALVFVAPAGTDAALKRVLVASNFNRPVQAVAPRSAASGTLYVVEQQGRILRWRSGHGRVVVQDIRGLVNYDGGERGLLSLAFNPNFATSHTLYVYYTNSTGDNEVDAYKMNSTGTRVVAGSRRHLLTIRHRSASNHNGGTLVFGPDNRLYLSTGDGGGGCDPDENAQNLSSRLGKLLQLSGTKVRIYGYGLRNPFRISFDRQTGDLWIGDVGQDSREEIDFLPAAQLPAPAENYEWDVMEGSIASGCSNNGYKGIRPHHDPIYDYPRTDGTTVIGGFVYRASAIPEAVGRYFFGDFGSGRIWSFVQAGGAVTGFRTEPFTVSQLSSFGEGPKGGLYMVSLGGSIYQLRAA